MLGSEPVGVGVAVGVLVATLVGVAVGTSVGVAVGALVGVAVGVVAGVGVALVAPLQALPFTLKLVGTGLLLVHAPLKPGLTDALTATLPFQLMLATDTFWPDCVQVPFQPCVTLWPLAGKVKARFQLVQAAEPVFWIVILPPKPPGHWLVMLYVT